MGIFLCDANNFYCSCESLFQPRLRGRPLVCLSNNDGAIVARSSEAKRIGVKMGTPYFKIREWFEAQGGVALSSNYALYGDMSGRFTSVIEDMVGSIERYSIDECFFSYTSRSGDLEALGRDVRQRVLQWTGLTISVGIGPTKTISKLASHAAKKWPKTGGVVDLHDEARRAKLMAITPLEEVWGIGPRLAARLQGEGLTSVADFVALPSGSSIRARYGVMLERTWLELHGVSCSVIDVDDPTRQQIVSSRSFGARISDRGAMSRALHGHVASAAAKLRTGRQRCQRIVCFIRSSPFDNRAPYYSNQYGVRLLSPTDDSRVLLGMVDPMLEQIWRDGYQYQSGGAMLTEFTSADNQVQQDLFVDAGQSARSQKLMSVVDEINQRYRGQIKFGSQGLSTESWAMRRDHLTQAYTTRWDSLPVAK